MTATRNILVIGAAALAAFGVVGCSSDGGSTNGSTNGSGSGSSARSDVVAYHADHPAYDSLDAVIEESGLVGDGSAARTDARTTAGARRTALLVDRDAETLVVHSEPRGGST
ncbi:hypothetical protein [Streptomyces sp. NPDC059092]|uniref:hypothetical protein n=1 Tax=Streptomyces sp. NPDC059092 TaxID=3346725 RepID=UPI0036C94DA8